MNVIYVSEFGPGSGYGSIATRLCTTIANQGVGVLGLGLDYKGEEHHWPFSLTPQPPPLTASCLKALTQPKDIEFHAVIVARDIPRHRSLLRAIGLDTLSVPYIGIYPIESGPLCASWAMALHSLTRSLVLSEHGTQMAQDAGVDAVHLPIGVDLTEWRRPAAEERQTIRQNLGFAEDEFFVLTVADNQERKNLAGALETIAYLAPQLNGRPLRYGLVTRPESPIGYSLYDYAIELGIGSHLQIWQRGMARETLWGLYAAADAFLLTSKAEGLGMPILEAMAVGVPVVGTDVSAIRDHLKDDRGFLIKSEYSVRDVWGNENRVFIDPRHGAKQLLAALLEPTEAIVEAAFEYVVAREWSDTGKVLMEVLNDVTA